ncbi:GGDEF domain-containing protein [Marinomonas epiphytica]
MYQEGSKQANQFMRQAVPLMQKLDIAPSPYNYGIWYEYVSNRNQQLNALMDDTLRKYGTFPSFVAKELFHEYLLSDEFSFQKDHKDRITNLAESMEHSSSSMSSDLKQLTTTIKKSRNALSKCESPAQVEKILSYLDNGSKRAIHSAQKFQHSLESVRNEVQKLNEEINQVKQNLELDQLTLLANEKGFERHLCDTLPYAEDDLSLLMIDIDNLAMINTEYGKRAGNALIRFVAQNLKTSGIPHAHLARLKGGTFAILVQEMELVAAKQHADKIRDNIASQRVRYKTTKVLFKPITVSIGVATCLGDESSNEFVERARQHLLAAKEAGKNSVSTWTRS